jgi:hypothetical protein
MKGSEHLEDLGRDERIILKVILKEYGLRMKTGFAEFTDFKEIGFEDVDWIYLAQDKDQRRSLVNRVMVP